MSINEKIFKDTAEKINKDFDFEQFKYHNRSLYDIIMKSMNNCKKYHKDKKINIDLKLDKDTMDSDQRFGKIKEYKKGDIVVWRGAYPCIGKIKRRAYLISLDSNKTKTLSKDCYCIVEKSHNSLHHSNLRKATDDEIEFFKNDILFL